MTTTELKWHIWKIRFNWCIVILSAIIAIVSMATSIFLTELCYSRWIKPVGTVQERVTLLERAIRLHPSKLDGYTIVLHALCEDGRLTHGESTHYKELINNNQSRISKTNGASDLYREIGFAYISCYDISPTERFRAAIPYFEIGQAKLASDPLVSDATETYLMLYWFCSTFRWQEGSIRQPSFSELESLLRQLSSTADSIGGISERERLAYACIVADFLFQNDLFLREKVGDETIDALAEKICQQTARPVSDPASIRLKEELLRYADAVEKG